MIRALLLRNLRHQRRLLAALLGGVIGIQILFVQIASAFEEGPGIDELFAVMPAGLRAFVSSQIGEASFSAFLGFSFQHPAALAMALSFVILNATQPTAELETGVLDLWLSRPLTRLRYLLACVVVFGLGALAFSMAELVGVFIGLQFVALEAEPAALDYVGCAVGQSALLLAFGGVAVLFAAGADRRGSAVASTVGVLLVMFLIDAFGKMYEPLGQIRWLSLFYYFQPAPSALFGTSWTDPLVLLSVFALATTAGMIRFQRRDI